MKHFAAAALLLTSISSPALNVPLSSAGATFSQGGYGPEKTIDAVVSANNGWAVSGGATSTQRIWWNSSGISGNGSLRRFNFVLNFRGTTGSSQQFYIKRFVLAYTTDTVVSNNSNWIPLTPFTASTSLPGSSALSINSTTGEISLSGSSGGTAIDYFVTADATPSAAITGFSLSAIPVSGYLGTALGGNFVLTEFSIDIPPTLITVPPNITVSEDDPIVSLALSRDDVSSGTLGIVGTVTGTANYPNDYNRNFSATHTFTFAGSNTTVPFTINPIGDNINESAETVVITWSSGPNYTTSSPATTITIGDTDGAGFDDYISGHGLAGNEALPDADPNDDGISNIEAYAFRLNPAGPFPAAWRERLPQFIVSSGGRSDFPAITWKLPQPYPSDLRFIVTESSPLTGWSEIARRSGYGVGSLWSGTTSASISDSGSPMRTIIVPGSQTIASRPKAFLRLTLEKFNSGGSN